MALRFHRPEGSLGIVPREWIDKKLPNCPFCKKAGVGWEMAIEGVMVMTIYHFRCPDCHGEISVPVSAMNDGNFSMGVEWTPNPQKPFTIESTGRSGSLLKVGSFVMPDDLRKGSGPKDPKD